MPLCTFKRNPLARRTRARIIMESLEARTFMTVAAVQTVVGTPLINDVILPLGPDTAISMSQFNPAKGTLLSTRVSFNVAANMHIQGDVFNPSNQPDAFPTLSGNVTVSIKVPGDSNFPGSALIAAVTQPLTTYTVVAGPGTQNDGSDGHLAININLSQKLSNSFTLTPGQAASNGYIGTGFWQGSTTGTGITLFSVQGGGHVSSNITWDLTGSAGITAKYFYVTPGTISGRVFNDLDPSTRTDNATDPALSGWILDLVGTTAPITDDQNNLLVAGGAAVNLQTTSLANGSYSFKNLAPGTYTVTEDASNFTNHPGTVRTFGGPYVLTIKANGTVVTGSNSGNNFGNATLPAGNGATGTIYFWHSSAGLAVILSSPGTQLSNWLATNYPNLYGSLLGNTNQAVSNLFNSSTNSYFGAPSPRTNAQVLATALSVYFDSVSNTSAAQSAGFGGNLLGTLVSIGANASAFPSSFSGAIFVGDMLKDANNAAAGGVIYGGTGSNFQKVFTQFKNVNELLTI